MKAQEASTHTTHVSAVATKQAELAELTAVREQNMAFKGCFCV